jgi:hypothetical protein
MFLYIWHWEYIYVAFSIPTEKKMNISTYEIFREMYFCVIFPFPPETVKLMVLILVKNKKQKSWVEERAITFEDVSLHFWDKRRGNPWIFYCLPSKEGESIVIQHYLLYTVSWRVALHSTFWDMMLCTPVKYQRRFEGNYCLPLQGIRVNYAKSRKIRSNAVCSFELLFDFKARDRKPLRYVC